MHIPIIEHWTLREKTREQNLSHRSWPLLISVVSLHPQSYISDCRNFCISQYIFTCYCYYFHLCQLFVEIPTSPVNYLQPSASSNQCEWSAFRIPKRWTCLDMYAELGNKWKYQAIWDTTNLMWHLQFMYMELVQFCRQCSTCFHYFCHSPWKIWKEHFPLRTKRRIST